MTEPWRDPERYKTGRIVKCLGCGTDCHKTNWGAWCYACNVKRIDRINGSWSCKTCGHIGCAHLEYWNRFKEKVGGSSVSRPDRGGIDGN